MTPSCSFRIQRTPVLLFDDECAVCRRIARWVRRSAVSGDGRPTVMVRAIGNDPRALHSLSPGLSIWDAYETIHLIMPDGTSRLGGEAVAETFRHLPSCERVARCLSWRVLGHRPFQGILDVAYLVLADVRPLLGCESCGTPSRWVTLVRSFLGIFRRRPRGTVVATIPHFTRTAARGVTPLALVGMPVGAG